MNDETKHERRAVWSRYWASGALHSCATSYRDNYAGPIGEFWRRAFAELVPGNTVLDIASGNGALPQLLLNERPETSIECDAIDLAEIAPAWLQHLEPTQRERIRLHGGVAAESLPFPDGTFSLVVSQYGVEYSDLSRAVPEMLRVLSPGGRIRLVVHHAGSRPVQLAREELEHIDWLLQPGGLVDAAAAMIPPMARTATPAGRAALAGDADANLARSRFNAMQTSASERVAASTCPDVLHEVREGIGQVLQIAVARGPETAAQALAALRRQLIDSRLRLDELRRHALDERAAQTFSEQLTIRGACATRMPITDGSHLMGWCLCVDPKDRGAAPTA